MKSLLITASMIVACVGCLPSLADETSDALGKKILGEIMNDPKARTHGGKKITLTSDEVATIKSSGAQASSSHSAAWYEEYKLNIGTKGDGYYIASRRNNSDGRNNCFKSPIVLQDTKLVIEFGMPCNM